MNKAFLIGFLALTGSSAFAAPPVQCRSSADDKTVISFTIASTIDGKLSLGDFKASQIPGSLGALNDSDITDRFVSPGAVEIRAKKIVDAIQGNAVISLRGDFDLTRLHGSITYVEQNQTTKKIDTAFIDLNCN
jgi:hypothetical protein